MNVSECLQSFVDFLEASQGADKIILIDHNAATFDFPVVLRAFQQYSPHLIEKMMELNVHFADSLVLIRNLIKDKHETLKVAEGSFVKTNQEALYKNLFGTDFPGHDALEDVKALKTIIFQSSLELSLSTIVKKSGTTELKSTIEELNYLDNTHALLKSFDNLIGDSSHRGVIKKSLAKKLGDSGLGYHHLKRLFAAHGERGLLAILANPPTDGSARRPRGTSDPVSPHLLLNHFKEKGQ